MIIGSYNLFMYIYNDIQNIHLKRKEGLYLYEMLFGTIGRMV